MSRHRAASDYNALKTGAKLLVGELGGVDAMAACTRASTSLASDYGNTSSNRFMPVDIVLDAESIAGRPLITETLARLQGYTLVPVTARASGELSAKAAEIGRDSATFFADLAAVLAHGSPTDRQRETLLRDLTELARVAAEAAVIIGAPHRLRNDPPAPAIPRRV